MALSLPPPGLRADTFSGAWAVSHASQSGHHEPGVSLAAATQASKSPLGGPPEGKFEDWVAKAKETPGSWWPDWLAWLTSQMPDKVPARKPGGAKLKPLGDAPGDYVRVKA